MASAAAFMIVIGLAILIFFFFAIMRNRSKISKSSVGSGNIISKITGGITPSNPIIPSNPITPAKPKPKQSSSTTSTPTFTSRFTNSNRTSSTTVNESCEGKPPVEYVSCQFQSLEKGIASFFGF